MTARTPTTSPWYEEGLCFSCTQCGDCCRVEGYVWVDAGGAEAISRFLGLDERVFARRYLRRVGRRTSLVEKSNYECIFWENGCTIYPVRPTQCRTFPFWPENLESREAWTEVQRECPGSGAGRCYSSAEIARLLEGRGETGDGTTP